MSPHNKKMQDILPPSPIAIPETSPFAGKLEGMVSHPDQLYEALKELGTPSYLLNFYFAVPSDLTSLGLGKCVHIPILVSDMEDGRKSVFHLSPGEEVLEGVFVNRDGVALCYIKRLDGDSTIAKVGDKYTQRIATLQGKNLLSGEGKLVSFDPETGSGTLSFELGPTQEEGEPKSKRIACKRKSWFWSFYSETHCESD